MSEPTKGATLKQVEGEFARDMLKVFNLSQEENANPRVVAIVVGAYIEDYLTGLIKKKLPGLNSALSDRIFRPSEGALGSLARKLDMARALEVLNADTCKEAVLIARIRNRFAHKIEVDSFDHPEVAELIDSLQSGRGVTVTKDGVSGPLDAGWTRKDRFTNSALGICAVIMSGHLPGTPYLYQDASQSPSTSIQHIPPQTGPKGPGPKDR